MKLAARAGQFSIHHSYFIASLAGGESGIRTHGASLHTRFPDAHLRPLGHLSARIWERGLPKYAADALREHLRRQLVHGICGLAERGGFEPPSGGYPLHDFESCAINRALPPLRGDQCSVQRSVISVRCGTHLKPAPSRHTVSLTAGARKLLTGAPGPIRTAGLQLRRLLLCPAELRGRSLSQPVGAWTGWCPSLFQHRGR